MYSVHVHVPYSLVLSCTTRFVFHKNINVQYIVNVHVHVHADALIIQRIRSLIRNFKTICTYMYMYNSPRKYMHKYSQFLWAPGTVQYMCM